jgi:hypothetical protein
MLAFFVAFSSLIFAYNDCHGPVLGGGQSGSGTRASTTAPLNQGTNTGNPGFDDPNLVSIQVLIRACNLVVNCHPGANFGDCKMSGKLSAPMVPAVGLTNNDFTVYNAVVVGEADRRIGCADSAYCQTCLNLIDGPCSAPVIQQAYDPSNSDPYHALNEVVQLGKCNAIFTFFN